jgi:2,4-dienoyl-CoA reductase-like NADH-dependent reductase (Old Yellow Enzyme family)
MSAHAARAAIPRVAALKTVAAFRAHVAALGLTLECDEAQLPAQRSPLAQPLEIAGRRVGNRFAVHPMEGWDGTEDGAPSPLTERRWRNFGRSGAKLVWGGEAVAVRPDGRANPNQLTYRPQNEAALAALLTGLKAEHAGRFGGTEDLLVGLQLTHSGRYCRPLAGQRGQPRVAFRHPLLDARVGLSDDRAVFSDAELDDLVGDYVAAARFAQRAGYDFVDVKHCHGYLLHELLGAHTRPGPYGGSLENRTRMLRQIVAGIRRDCPGLMIGVRVSAFDSSPFAMPGPGDPPWGVPVPLAGLLPYRWGFGVDAQRPLEPDLDEPIAFLRLCRALGIPLVNLTGGSPYYNPHVQRPALFPPSDGYPPPEDPLVGCARHLSVTAALKRAVPELVVVGTGYTYLQDYVAHVAQAQVRLGHVDAVGLGRMMLAYPELPADVLAGRPLARARLCRTFSDCTTGPRHDMVSGCFPLDAFYKARPEAARIKALKRPQARSG